MLQRVNDIWHTRHQARFYTQRGAMGAVAVKIAADRRVQAEVPRQLRHRGGPGRLLPTAEDLQAASPGDAEVREQAAQLHAREAILQRVRQHRDATGLRQPAGDAGQGWPAGLDVADPAATKVAVK